MAAVAEEFDLHAVVARLRHAKARIVQCVEWARATEEVWLAFNQAKDDRHAIAASPASEAARVYEKAALDAQIVMITRLLDPPSRYGALATNRMSLPVCRDLLALPGVADRCAEEAKGWNELGDASAGHVWERLERFRGRLNAIEEEADPNRAALLRDFRDENIAHELHFEEKRERPLFRHIRELLDEVMALTEDLAFVVEGDVIRWRRDETTASARALWRAVAEAYPLEAKQKSRG
ncbi:hypothetical protein [Phenylobacterium sp.]|uniref:AbiU2 domain-containing protein n=1 Tax=Phenylobacterium sp. TaxID=1871053 RepID=UPI0025CCB234|nr:hypothetical protein [Phenylobacterium sp.]